jgi:ABC-type dipeptide/oligopeptide/nickel transport system ATPase component
VSVARAQDVGPLLELKSLKTHFFTQDGTVKAVDDVSFSIAHGQTLGVVGESGCGKSITSLAIMGLLPRPIGRLTRGEIRFEGRTVTIPDPHAARELGNRRQLRDDVKVVAVDPVCSPAASRAEEWVPIRPGTDAALILGMVNQLINEFDLYDREFVHEKTNAPYLIDEDGYYLRAEDGERPLVCVVEDAQWRGATYLAGEEIRRHVSEIGRDASNQRPPS